MGLEHFLYPLNPYPLKFDNSYVNKVYKEYNEVNEKILTIVTNNIKEFGGLWKSPFVDNKFTCSLRLIFTLNRVIVVQMNVLV